MQRVYTKVNSFSPQHLSRLRRLHSHAVRRESTDMPEFQSPLHSQQTGYLRSVSSIEHPQNDCIAHRIQNLLKVSSNSSDCELHRRLDGIGVKLLNEDVVLDVIKRHSSDWKPAFQFFNWVSRGPNLCGYKPGSCAYNEILGILGKMKRFEELTQVLDEMSKTEGLLNERTYEIVVHRYAAAHDAEGAIKIFHGRKDYGLELDLVAFHVLLMSLCRYKHVEEAEHLFHLKKDEFQYDIKTWNIILNGWSVRNNIREAKRFWKGILRSDCRPDVFTYGTFINSLCKSGKISTAVKLLNGMWNKGCTPDVVICNSVIDGLCFKKRVPDALEIFQQMNEKGCLPDVATYNSLIKHLCKIRRMDKVYELLGEMEEKKGICFPNSRTYTHLLKSVRNGEEIDELLFRMDRNGCRMTADMYNLLLRLYLNWGCEEKVESTWAGMERDGLGPNQSSYTIMVHGLYERERPRDALRYFEGMISKGMVPEPKTKLLVYGGQQQCS